VSFHVLQTLKGAAARDDLRVEGEVATEDDRNDAAVPYDFVRPGGRHGNCYAFGYRRGAEYLLFLKSIDVQGQPVELTPYWAPLSPTNEQVSGEDDAWVRWVGAEVRAAQRF
jgi:hypothetical protein